VFSITVFPGLIYVYAKVLTVARASYEATAGRNRIRNLLPQLRIPQQALNPTEAQPLQAKVALYVLLGNQVLNIGIKATASSHASSCSNSPEICWVSFFRPTKQKMESPRSPGPRGRNFMGSLFLGVSISQVLLSMHAGHPQYPLFWLDMQVHIFLSLVSIYFVQESIKAFAQKRPSRTRLGNWTILIREVCASQECLRSG